MALRLQLGTHPLHNPLQKNEAPSKKRGRLKPQKTMASTAHLAPHPRVGESLASLLGAPIGLSLPPRLVPPSARPRVRVDIVGRSLGQSFRLCLG